MTARAAHHRHVTPDIEVAQLLADRGWEGMTVSDVLDLLRDNIRVSETSQDFEGWIELADTIRTTEHIKWNA